MLGLGCCTQAFSGCSKQGLFSGCGVQASHWGSCSCCGAQAIGVRASEVAAHRFSCPAACGIFLDKDQTCVPCVIHWTTKEVCRNEIDFFVHILSVILLNSFITCILFFLESLRFSVLTMLSSINTDNFVSSFTTCLLFISSSCVVAVATLPVLC